MKSKHLICLALPALLMTGCASEAAFDASSNTVEVNSTQAPSPDNPTTVSVQADWSRLGGERTAPQPDVDGGRWYPEFTDNLIPREDYGPLVPYWGSLVYPVQRWEDDTGETHEYWFDLSDAFYGLMTREGKIVVDPVYQNAFSYSYHWQGEELSLPVLILCRSDPAWAETGGARYAVAAEDGSWTTDFDFLLYTNRGDQLLLLGLQGITRLDSSTGARRNWTWEELGVREEDVSRTLSMIQWGYGLTWTEHGVLAGTSQEESNGPQASLRFRIFQPDTGEISWVDGGQWDAWRDEYFEQRQGRTWEMSQSRKGSQVTLSSDGESYVIPDAPVDCLYAEVRNGLVHLQSNSGHQLRRLSDGELLLEGAYIEFIPDAVHPDRLGCVSVQNDKDYTIYDADMNPILSLPRAGNSWLRVELRDGLLSYYYYDNSRFGCWDMDAGRYIFYRNLYLGD